MKRLFHSTSSQPHRNLRGRLHRLVATTLMSCAFLSLSVLAKASVYYKNETPYFQVVRYNQIINLDTRGGKIYRNEQFTVTIAPGETVEHYDYSVPPGSATGTISYVLVSVGTL